MPSAFTVATYNVENLNSIGTLFAGRSDSAPYTEATFNEKAAFVARMLDRIGAPAIIGVQEIFDIEALKSCVARSSMPQASVLVPESRVRPARNGTPAIAEGPNVGLVTTLPVIGVPQVIRAFPSEIDIRVPLGSHDDKGEVIQVDINRFERPLLRAELHVPGLPGLTVLVTHLKSKRAKALPSEDERRPAVRDLGSLRSLIIRACEAAALRSVIRSIRAERASDGRRRPLIVLGDVNDDIGSVTTRMLEGSRPFPRGDSKTVSRQDAAASVADLMLNALELSPPADGKMYSHVFNGTGSLIDMVLLSADFYGVEGFNRARVTSTRIELEHLDDKPVTTLSLPPVEPFDPREKRFTPTDPLNDVIRPNGPKPPAPPSQKSDHGVPIVRIEMT